MMKLIVAVGLASWAAVASSVETEPCERWDDIGTNLALPEEIEEVKNAKAAYVLLEKVDPYSLKDLLKVHGLMVGGLTAQAGRFRTVEVGVYSGKKLVHAGIPHKLVPGMMRELLSWVRNAGVHPLISSCVFHYGLEYIHPFTDGNGRMGRYWQTALLSSWRAQMAWVPVEEIVRDRQDAYYSAISDADRTGDARRFIEFMLVALRDVLVDVKRSVGKGVVKSVVKILELIAQYPDITRERLAKEVGLSVRGVEKNLAQLKAEGKIVRVGGRKGGHWEVVKETRSNGAFSKCTKFSVGNCKTNRSEGLEENCKWLLGDEFDRAGVGVTWRDII